MREGIHPQYAVTEVTCSCGNTFTTRSTAKTGVIHADVCSACHPFYTGKQKILDTGSRVARFEQRYAMKGAAKKDDADNLLRCGAGLRSRGPAPFCMSGQVGERQRC